MKARNSNLLTGQRELVVGQPQIFWNRSLSSSLGRSRTTAVVSGDVMADDWQTATASASRRRTLDRARQTGEQLPPGDRPATAPLCRFIQVGQCVAGSQCKFSHAASPQARGMKLAALCKFWADGYCAHGERCNNMFGQYIKHGGKV